MSAVTLHELNQRYVRLTDRCRSQWTFYQLLQGLFKHLQESSCPADIDFPSLFNKLRELGVELGHPETQRTERAIGQLNAQLDKQAETLLAVDAQVSPSLLRRFFDRLRNQDEKVLLAIIKFYLDAGSNSEDTLDKLDLLLTRLAEIPRPEGGSLVREKHEIERIVQPLLQHRATAATPENEIEILLHAVADLKGEVLACRSFGELMASGALDRFRTLKRRLGASLLHPRLLPAALETTVAIKNRFRELWEDEEAQIMDDTNRVMELKRQLAIHPELVTPDLRDALDTFASAHARFDHGKQEENLRREDILELRRTLNAILDQFDTTHQTAVVAEPTQGEIPPSALASAEGDGTVPGDRAEPPPESPTTNLPFDPLLSEYVSKIVFALELVGRDRGPTEAVHAKELATLRLEPWEVEACRRTVSGHSTEGSLTGERDRLFLHSAALRVRLDEEAREIDRLQRRGSERLADLLERATASLQRAAEMERRFQWFIDDALYRGDTDHLEPLYRSRFRLLRAYSGLWLIHNERGGTSPF